MAGLLFGSAMWDDIPQQLGLTVTSGGVMNGPWQGVHVSATFQTREEVDPSSMVDRRRWFHFTNIRARIDPPLGVQGLDRGVHFDRIVDPALRAEVEGRARACGVGNIGFSDDAIIGTSSRYESTVAVYRAVFDLFAWAVNTIQERRTQSPPPWEVAIAQAWPSLAQGWNLQLNARLGEMSGIVRGRPTRARIVNKGGVLMTCVEVAAPLPAGCCLSLARQNDDYGFIDSLFSNIVGGNDIVLGDAAFDAAFVVKGTPETFVRAALTPTARQQILALAGAGASITFEGGNLTVWTRHVLVSRDDLDSFMKAAFTAASALGVQVTPSMPPAPYR